jgi:beta-glucanase (GH16 family)
VLAFEDEFQGTALDATKWTVEAGVRRDAVSTPDAAQVRDGLLTVTTFTTGGRHQTAFLTTQDHYLTAFGYFEARIMFNDSPGEWCAFWLFARRTTASRSVTPPPPASRSTWSSTA